MAESPFPAALRAAIRNQTSRFHTYKQVVNLMLLLIVAQPFGKFVKKKFSHIRAGSQRRVG